MRPASQSGDRCNALYVHKSLMAVFDLPARSARDPDGNRRRLRRQGRLSLGPGFARRPAGPKAGRPIKMVYDRMEDLAATTKRIPRARAIAPQSTRMASCWRWRSTLPPTAAHTPRYLRLYCRAPRCIRPAHTFAPTCALHPAPGLQIQCPYGAFRGFGAPQSIFAIERHMEQIALAVGIDSAEIRRRNFLHDGRFHRDRTDHARTAHSGHTARPRIERKRLRRQTRTFARKNPQRDQARHGMAAFYHGAGFTGSGERYLNSLAGIDVPSTAKFACS
jgi:CO/xanthine dehydrogenase Mo-binding subunit